MRRAVPFVLMLPLASAPAAAQSSANDQARSLLEDGRAYRRQGKLKQALDNFNTIVTGFPSTEFVDDALLEIGSYRMEVEGDVQKAKQAFEEVTRRFPQSDGAPGAYYYLGWLTMRRAATPAELEDALAQFDRLIRLYPRSDWVPRALHASALAHRRAGRLAEAVSAARRAALEHPASDAAPAAQFLVGESLALFGEHRQAMEEFQRVRNHFPASEWAGRARDRITALYRLHGTGRPSFILDTQYALPGGDILKAVRALLMAPDGTLWVASDKVKAVVPFAGGKAGASLPGVDLKSLSLGPAGELVVAARLAVRIGPKDLRSFDLPPAKPGQEPKRLDEIEAAVLTPGGSVLVSNEKHVHRFDRAAKHLGTFPDAKERRVVRMWLDGEGAVLLLDRDSRTVSVYDETGRLLRSAGPRGPGFELKRPVDVTVDAFRNLHVADEDAVFVLSPAGQLLATVGAGTLRRPAALTVEPSGAVLVYDEKLETVLRFR